MHGFNDALVNIYMFIMDQYLYVKEVVRYYDTADNNQSLVRFLPDLRRSLKSLFSFFPAQHYSYLSGPRSHHTFKTKQQTDKVRASLVNVVG